MITLQRDAITALAGLKWTRKNIQEAMNVSTTDIQVVLGKDARGRKAVKLDARVKVSKAKKAKK